MTLLTLWLTFMHTMAPREPVSQFETVAQTVVNATSDPHEQAMLLTVSLYETSWGRRGIPFGVSSMQRRATATAAECAAFALRILRRARSMCPRSIAAQLGFYHHGNGCTPDRYSLREADMVMRMRQWVQSQNVALVPIPGQSLARSR